MFVFLLLAYFTQHGIFQFHPNCSKSHDFIVPCSCIVFYCVYISHLHNTSAVGHLGWFHILAIVLSEATNNSVLTFFLISVFKSCGRCPKVELPGCSTFQFSVYWGLCILFSTGTVPDNIPTSSGWGFLFSPHSANTDCFYYFWYIPFSLVWDGISLSSWFGFL